MRWILYLNSLQKKLEYKGVHTLTVHSARAGKIVGTALEVRWFRPEGLPGTINLCSK